MISPLTGGATKKVSTIPVADIIAMYQPYCDVARFFTNLTEVEIHECVDTGYRFYYPYTVAGDGPFYEALSREALYYVSWKQEHTVADEFIAPGNTVLELGCASGDFLMKLMQTKNISAYGTEINEEAKRTAEARGINFTSVTTADVTCAFQVLEHIADVQTFITAALAATKSGGHIIFSVPDNASLIRLDKRAFLNMPPHHMGLWTPSSLRALANHFPMSVVDIRTENLQPNHYRWYYQLHFGNYLSPLGLIGRVINKLVFELLARPLIALRAKHLSGHTVVAIFKKQ